MGMEAGAPLVSVVMPVLDPHPVYFREALESLCAQSLKDIEIIIIEAPSPRSAEDTVRSLGDPRIRYVRNAERTSLARQRNQGLALARAELVASHDADDIAEPERLAKQHAFLAGHPSISVLGSQLQIIDENGEPLGYRRYPRDHASIVRAMRLFNSIPHPAVMFRREDVLAAGGYQYESYPTEDFELWSRLAARSLRFANHPEALERYRIHAEAGKSRKLHSTIRGTLDVKQMYWREARDPVAMARKLGEHLLLRVPPRIVLELFLRTQLSSSL